MAFCDICGTTLDEDEEEREINGRQVCHDCLHNGLELLQDKTSQLKREGRDRLESKRQLEQEKAEEAAKDGADTAESGKVQDTSGE
jgi:hypothetical protein